VVARWLCVCVCVCVCLGWLPRALLCSCCGVQVDARVLLRGYSVLRDSQVSAIVCWVVATVGCC